MSFRFWYLLALAYPVSTSHGLDVILGVPVRVKDNDRVSRGKIQAQTTGSCRKQETEVLDTENNHGGHMVNYKTQARHTHQIQSTVHWSVFTSNIEAIASITKHTFGNGRTLSRQ